MIVGHTKFSPDSHFGAIKSKLRENGYNSILDLIGDNGFIINNTYNKFYNIAIPYKNPIKTNKILFPTLFLHFTFFKLNNFCSI